MKLHSPPSVANQSGRPQNTLPGFALVVTLSLMILLTIIAVGLLSLSSVALRSSSQDKAMATARANARLALMLAIGELQKEAGPDQRISARAEILDTGDTTLRNTVVKQPLWTGVWKTGNKPTESQRTDSFNQGKVKSAAWLVSNPKPNLATPLDPSTWTGAYPNGVMLAKGKGINAIDVTVPLVPITSSVPAAASTQLASGRYGYWVSDEGVKAKVNLQDPTFGVSGFVQNQLHYLVPQAVPVNTKSTSPVNSGLLGEKNTTDIRGDKANLGKVLTLSSLALMPGLTFPPTTPPINPLTIYSPDVTTCSSGILADIRYGGLKVDLSTTFEDPTQYKAFLTAKQTSNDADGDAKLFSIVPVIYPSPPNPNIFSTYIFGPRWQGLYNYYSLYKNIIPANGQGVGVCPFNGLNNFSGGNPGTTAPKIDMRAYNYSSKPSPGASAADCPGESYMPRMVGISVQLALASEQVAKPSGNNPATGLPYPTPAAGQHYYKFRIHAEPRITYYNPYNVTLSSPTVSAAVSKFQLNYTSNILGPSWTLKLGPTTVINNKSIFEYGMKTDPITGIQTLQTGGLTLLTDPNPQNLDLSMAPGQLRVFGLKTQNSTAVPVGNAIVFDGLPTTGYSKRSYLSSDVGQSQWSYVPDDRVVAATYPDWVGLANDSDAVTISTPAVAFRSNNGRYKINLSSTPSWPKSGLGVLQLGRFFDNDTNNAAQNASMGPISGLAGSQAPFGYFTLRSKGINQSKTSGAVVAMPVFSSCDGNISPFPLRYDAASVDIDFQVASGNPNSSTELQVTGSPPNVTTFWGNKNVGRDSADTNGFVLADIPRQPLLSLGQFMHAPLRNSMATLNNVEMDQCSPLMSVGGSLCNPFVPLGLSYDAIPNGNGASAGKTPVIDDNYMMNEALFDSYFFSSVPPGSPDAAYKAVFPTLTAGNGTGAFNDTNIKTSTVTLPNARMKFYAKSGVPPTAVALQKNSTTAANLLMDGAFNVNSTSVAAWAALLSSPTGNTLNMLANGGFSQVNLLDPVTKKVRVPILRYPSVVSADGKGQEVNKPFGGVHALTTEQITELATAIVKEVKSRGPFLSLADFINRRLDTNPATGLGFKGALQAAIDATNINTTNIGSIGMTSGDVVGGMNVQGPAGNNKLYTGQVPTNTAIGIPGWLMQQDLVQGFSPIMTVRSDTFVIRAYGEAVNPATGTVIAKAWCEAVVQRVPDYVDQNDPALIAGANPLGDATPVMDYKTNPLTPTPIVNAVNQTFGRRFNTISFRWLQNENDI